MGFMETMMKKMKLGSAVFIVIQELLVSEAENNDIPKDKIGCLLMSNANHGKQISETEKDERLVRSWIYNNATKLYELTQQKINDYVSPSELKALPIKLPDMKLGEAIFVIIDEILIDQAKKNECELKQVSALLILDISQKGKVKGTKINIMKDYKFLYTLPEEEINKYINN